MKQQNHNPLLQLAQLQGWLVVIFGVFGFFGWAAFYPIDQGIPGSGFLISKAERIQVISPKTGYVSTLNKLAGDSVKEGDILFEFDIQILESNLNSLQKSIHGIEIANSSLRLALNAKKSQVSALQAEYEVVLDLVKSEFTLDNSLDRSNGHQISDAPTQSALDGRKRQLSAVRSQYDSALKLVESGFVSANSLATSQIQLSQAETELLDYKSQVNQNKYRLQSQLSLVESEILESMARIAQNDQRINELKESMTTVRHEMALSKIRSPATGKVMNTSIKSAGLNITAGTQMMEIVPDSERLLIEARIPVDYATRAQVGMPVVVMFPTLPGSSTFRIKGTVEYLSADRLTDTQTNQIYLEGRVSLDEQASIDQLHLRAGLPASVLLNTGPRTLLSYITRPLTERMTKGLQ